MSEILTGQVPPIPSFPRAKVPSLLKESVDGLKNAAIWRSSKPRNYSQQVNVLRWSKLLQVNVSGCAKDLVSFKAAAYSRKSHQKILSPDFGPQKPIRTLLVDNYDSYTYNLYQLLYVINGVAPVVLRNDEITWDDLYRLLYKERAFHNVVISPGPGSPTRASDVGTDLSVYSMSQNSPSSIARSQNAQEIEPFYNWICMQLLQECHDIPILGVCLGHQALGYVHGAQILHAPEPVHGRLRYQVKKRSSCSLRVADVSCSEIEHSGHPLFASIPSGVNSGFKVVRYHSLMVDTASLPGDLVPTAWTVIESGFMGLEDWQPESDTPNALSREGQLLWPGRGSDSSNSEYPKVVSNGLLGFDDVIEVTHKKRTTKVLMGVSHKSWPHHGVQFHPESVATTYGKQILVNFRNITVNFWRNQLWRPTVLGKHWVNPRPLNAGLIDATWKENVQAAEGLRSLSLVDQSASAEARVNAQLNDGQCLSVGRDKQGGGNGSSPMIKPEPVKATDQLRLHWRKLSKLASRAGGSRTLFCKLFTEEAIEDTFWLDSSTREQGRARFSFMGGRGGSLWQRITYRIAHDSTVDKDGGVLRFQNATGQVKEIVVQGGFLNFLNKELELRQCRKEDYASLPFDFCGGFVGYLGYELKEECGAESNQHRSPMPDAGMFLADRVVVVDHNNDDVYVLALFQDGSTSPLPAKSKNFPEESFYPNRGNSSSCHEMVTVHGVDKKKENFSKLTSLLGPSYVQSDGLMNGQTTFSKGEDQCGRRTSEAWVDKIVRKINFLAQQDLHTASEQMHHVNLVSAVCRMEDDIHPPFVAEKSRISYIQDVKRCQEFITDGESYEVCLTTQLRRKVVTADCFGLYLALRETNPAPYSSWLHFGKDGPCICSSSPERFLQLDRKGLLEAKPIKGTVARGNTPVEDETLKFELQHSEKDQAENLMIVDLLRNDLGRVCEPGTVHVPSLMAVESYSTVHTMVSTVRGKKRLDVSAVDCVRAAFPGGSMTGAPKLRTMEIIDSLESSPRGIYSGSIGYFSFNSSFDLNIVIRTLVIHEDEASLGAGGAVISLSDPVAEYEEMLLKTKAPIRAVSMYENALKLATATDQRGPVLPLGL